MRFNIWVNKLIHHHILHHIYTRKLPQYPHALLDIREKFPQRMLPNWTNAWYHHETDIRWLNSLCIKTIYGLQSTITLLYHTDESVSWAEWLTIQNQNNHWQMTWQVTTISELCTVIRANLVCQKVSKNGLLFQKWIVWKPWTHTRYYEENLGLTTSLGIILTTQ